MTIAERSRLAIVVTSIFLFSIILRAQAPNSLPSETPQHFQTRTDSFEYTRREVMIPMRDGIKLHTVILIPKSANHAPILLTRTPTMPMT